MAQEFAFLMKVLLSGSYRSVSPVDFKLALGSLSRRFLTYEQQDSHEVLLIVLDGLHNDVNKVNKAFLYLLCPKLPHEVLWWLIKFLYTLYGR